MIALLNLVRRAAHVDSRAARRARHDYHCVFASLKRRLQRLLGDRMASARVLDYGCGYTYPNVVFLHDLVGEIHGVDVSPVFRDGVGAAIAWRGGLRRPGTTAELVLEHANSARYYHYLAREARLDIRHPEYRVQQYDGSRLPVADAGLDCVISNAVLQELPEPLEQFAAEIARVLRPGGVVDLEWHNFYSLTGNYLGDEESRKHPWEHLLGGFYHPTLNRATPDRILEAFSDWFTDLRLLRHDRPYRIAGEDTDFESEGEDLLTPELAEKLKEYPREWLLTRGYILQGVRR